MSLQGIACWRLSIRVRLLWRRACRATGDQALVEAARAQGLQGLLTAAGQDLQCCTAVRWQGLCVMQVATGQGI